MCNLYDIGRPRNKSRNDWEEAVAQALGDTGGSLPKRYGIRKTDPSLVLLGGEKAPAVEIMRWGFHRPFNPAINNARSDKLDGMWSDSWEQKRRCLIPIHSFYEWTGPTGNKQTFAFASADPAKLLWAAGIWEPTRDSSVSDLPSYSMLTTGSSPAIEHIHHRMPALLKAEQFEEFLDAENPRHLLQPFDGELDIFRCENPLKNPGGHKGPVRQGMLPGFD